MKTLKLAVAALLSLSLASCCACRKNKSTVPLIDTEWKLSQLNGAAVSGTHIDSFTMTLHAEGKVSGVGDCNRYSGGFTRTVGSNSTSGKLSMGDDMISTRMMCPGQDRELEYLKMLRLVDSYSIDGERLMLIRGGDVLAIFDRVTEPVVSTQPIDEPVPVQP